MALYSRVHVWVSNEVLTASDLNNEFNNILNNADAAHLIGASANVSAMQAVTDPGGVGTESLAGSVTDELQRLRYMMKFLSGKAQWYDHTGRSLATGSLAVQTADIADNAVTQAKRAALGQQISSSSGNFSTNATSYADVTNLTVTITTTGRPVYIGLIGDGTGATSNITGSSSVDNDMINIYVNLLRGATSLMQPIIGGIIGSHSTTVFQHLPGLFHVDVPSAGTYTYKIQTHTASSNQTASFSNLKLIAFEL